MSRARLLLPLPHCCALEVSAEAPRDVFTYEKNHMVNTYVLPAFEWLIPVANGNKINWTVVGQMLGDLQVELSAVCTGAEVFCNVRINFSWRKIGL